jgi:multidrug resistance efflux pump
MTASDDAEVPKDGPESNASADAAQVDPVRRLIRWAAILAVALFVWYLASDHYTPYTDQARVDGYVVPVVPEVSGRVIEVAVAINQLVDAGQLLLKIDPHDYELAVADAEAGLERAGQDVGAGTAEIAAAQARLADAKAQLETQRIQTDRRITLEGLGVASKSEADRARAQLSRDKGKLGTAQADLQKAMENLGDDGRNNTGVRSAMAALEKARYDLARTSIYAPSVGGMTNVDIGVGQYATKGQPIMTFISASDAWVVADLRENSLRNIDVGDEAEILLDVAPGRVFKGTVASIGYGVETSSRNQLGALPTVSGQSGWLREPQRFPVIVRFADDEARGLRRAGGQADVVIYTGDGFVLNTLASLWIRFVGLLSFVY